MQVTHEEVAPFWKTLEFSSFQPPREAVAALFALAAPTELEDVHVGATWAEPGCAGAVTWTLLALTTGGLAIVTATADDQWDWRREEHRKPAQTSVDARWVPFSQVQGITLDVSRVEPTERKSDGSHYGLQFSDSWTILLAGGEPLRLTADQSEDAPNRLRTFVGRVRSAL